VTKPPRPLRDGGRLDELILHAPLGRTLAAQGSTTTELAQVRHQVGAVNRVSAELGREASSAFAEAAELVDRPCSNPRAVPLEGAARLLGVGRSSTLALLGSGRVHSVRVGGRGTGSAR
jgi:hypothetical protein